MMSHRRKRLAGSTLVDTQDLYTRPKTPDYDPISSPFISSTQAPCGTRRRPRKLLKTMLFQNLALKRLNPIQQPNLIDRKPLSGTLPGTELGTPKCTLLASIFFPKPCSQPEAFHKLRTQTEVNPRLRVATKSSILNYWGFHSGEHVTKLKMNRRGHVTPLTAEKAANCILVEAQDRWDNARTAAHSEPAKPVLLREPA
jgi:hypothetical protein